MQKMIQSFVLKLCWFPFISNTLPSHLLHTRLNFPLIFDLNSNHPNIMFLVRSNTIWNHLVIPLRLLVPGNFPGSAAAFPRLFPRLHGPRHRPLAAEQRSGVRARSDARACGGTNDRCWTQGWLAGFWIVNWLGFWMDYWWDKWILNGL